MIEIENFISKDDCQSLITFFKKSKDFTKFKNRYFINLFLHDENKLINTVINKYKKLLPLDNLDHLQLIFWPIGEYHDWHDDTEFYDTTTITYLNEDYKGGITHVEDYKIKPNVGKICIFESYKKHKVTKLEDGERFVILAWYKNG